MNKYCKLYFEFPDFGFGPASTTCNVINKLQKIMKANFIVIAFGTALEFAKKTLRDVTFIELDTNNTEYYVQLLSVIKSDDIVITNTNLDFCRWSVNNNFRTIMIDTLFWMWECDLDFIPKTEIYIVQNYYQEEKIYNINFHRYKEQIIVVPPIIDVRENRADDTEKDKFPNHALISFGGMATPFNRKIIFEYCNLIIPGLITALQRNCVQEIHIVGGLIEPYISMNPNIANDKNVTFYGSVSQQQYKKLLDCQYLFLSPGLTSIYETIAMNKQPFFLPGFSMSQVLQAISLKSCTAYPYIANWNEIDDVLVKIESMSETDGSAYLNGFLEQSVKESYELPFLEDYLKLDDMVKKSISQYIKQDRSTNFNTAEVIIREQLIQMQ